MSETGRLDELDDADLILRRALRHGLVGVVHGEVGGVCLKAYFDGRCHHPLLVDR